MEPTRYNLLLFYGVPYLTGYLPGFWEPTPRHHPCFGCNYLFRKSYDGYNLKNDEHGYPAPHISGRAYLREGTEAFLMFFPF